MLPVLCHNRPNLDSGSDTISNIALFARIVVLRIAYCFIIALSVMAWRTGPVQAAGSGVDLLAPLGTTRTVTTTQDGGVGSLRQHILDSASGDTIIFSADVFSVAVTLQLLGQLDIAKTLSIDGAGVGVITPTLSTGAQARTFRIGNGGALSLNRLKITDSEGGAIYVADGALLLMSHVTLSGNGTTNTIGGALFNKGVVRMSNATLSSNTASYGGAVRNEGVLYANRVIFSGNTSQYGGAIRNSGGALTALLSIENSAIYNNAAISTTSATGYGGGIHNLYPATVVMTNTTLFGNIARFDGGAIWNGTGTSLTMLNVTISDNSASHSGGGIASSGYVAMANSIVAMNNGGNCAKLGGSIADNGGNLEDTNTCNQGNDVNILSYANTNPMLGPFISLPPWNIPSIMIMRGSPAIDAAIDAVCPSTDAHGAARMHQGTHCDIGAFESFGSYTFVPQITQ